MRLSPNQSLLLLILVGLAIGGWVYGIHWKNVAGGSGFTGEEKLIFRLQEQIEVLTRQNADLNTALREARGETDDGAVDKRQSPGPVSTMPLLQEQKVELPRK